MRPVVRAEGFFVQAAERHPPWLACDLEVASVAEVVGLLIAAKRTGRLDVTDPTGSRSLFFETGEFTGSSSTHIPDRLGEVLWRSGTLRQDQMLIASEQVKEGKLLGRALIELGFMEPAGLRKALVVQAIHVFEAACLEQVGYALFRADAFHPSPIRFGVSTQELVDGAIVRTREHRELMRKIGSLDRPCHVASPAPTNAPLDETALALLQLAASGRGKEITGQELIDKASLGRIAGARALWALLDKGYLVPRLSVADEELKVKRLAGAINLVMAALDDAGFGVGDQVREYLDSPPPSYEEALSGLSLAQPLDGAAVLQHAKFIHGGHGAMIKALQAVLDDALMQAADTLPEELTKKVGERVKALGA